MNPSADPTIGKGLYDEFVINQEHQIIPSFIVTFNQKNVRKLLLDYKTQKLPPTTQNQMIPQQGAHPSDPLLQLPAKKLAVSLKQYGGGKDGEEPIIVLNEVDSDSEPSASDSSHVPLLDRHLENF